MCFKCGALCKNLEAPLIFYEVFLRTQEIVAVINENALYKREKRVFVFTHVIFV